MVARSLDWKTPIPTNIYVYPRGIEKQSSNLSDAIRWKSKYGAVYAVGYDGGITEGMNEKGLVINGLFCKTAVYEKMTADNDKPYMSLAVFVAWLLDNNATVPSVVTAFITVPEVRAQLEKRDFRIQGATFDGGTVSTLHWGVTDATGQSMIFEFTGGDLKCYDMEDYRAMTNDPEWPGHRDQSRPVRARQLFRPSCPARHRDRLRRLHSPQRISEFLCALHLSGRRGA